MKKRLCVFDKRQRSLRSGGGGGSSIANRTAEGFDRVEDVVGKKTNESNGRMIGF